jgi:hypothetical protein
MMAAAAAAARGFVNGHGQEMDGWQLPQREGWYYKTTAWFGSVWTGLGSFGLAWTWL